MYILFSKSNLLAVVARSGERIFVGVPGRLPYEEYYVASFSSWTDCNAISNGARASHGT
jgi:hypothetical protein